MASFSTGVDPALFAGTGVSPNFAFGYDSNILAATMLGDGKSIPSLDGDDLVTSTNGYNDEYFDHQAEQLTILGMFKIT